MNVQLASERSEQDSLGELDANLRYIWGTYLTTFCSGGTPYIKGAEVGHSHFFRSVAWAELSITIGYTTGTKNVLKRKVYCLVFCLLTMALLL